MVEAASGCKPQGATSSVCQVSLLRASSVWFHQSDSAAQQNNTTEHEARKSQTSPGAQYVGQGTDTSESSPDDVIAQESPAGPSPTCQQGRAWPQFHQSHDIAPSLESMYLFPIHVFGLIVIISPLVAQEVVIGFCHVEENSSTSFRRQNTKLRSHRGGSTEIISLTFHSCAVRWLTIRNEPTHGERHGGHRLQLTARNLLVWSALFQLVCWGAVRVCTGAMKTDRQRSRCPLIPENGN